MNKPKRRHFVVVVTTDENLKMKRGMKAQELGIEIFVRICGFFNRNT